MHLMDRLKGIFDDRAEEIARLRRINAELADACADERSGNAELRRMLQESNERCLALREQVDAWVSWGVALERAAGEANPGEVDEESGD